MPYVLMILLALQMPLAGSAAAMQLRITVVSTETEESPDNSRESEAVEAAVFAARRQETTYGGSSQGLETLLGPSDPARRRRASIGVCHRQSGHRHANGLLAPLTT